ncbi:hypothetical protein B0H10DRAFT_1955086 [Mycena sp. CBHHK59/15]|nr:hypothetical protein B0H10DRAFT_1955086 [Mycena sp. CBHHK59/15]
MASNYFHKGERQNGTHFKTFCKAHVKHQMGSVASKPSARVMEEEERLMEALADAAEDDIPNNNHGEIIEGLQNKPTQNLRNGRPGPAENAESQHTKGGEDGKTVNSAAAIVERAAGTLHARDITQITPMFPVIELGGSFFEFLL